MFISRHCPINGKNSYRTELLTGKYLNPRAVIEYIFKMYIGRLYILYITCVLHMKGYMRDNIRYIKSSGQFHIKCCD